VGFTKISPVKVMLYRGRGLKELIPVVCRFIILFECSSVGEFHICLRIKNKLNSKYQTKILETLAYCHTR